MIKNTYIQKAMENLIEFSIIHIVLTVFIQTVFFFIGFKLSIISFFLAFFGIPIIQIFILKEFNIFKKNLISFCLYLLLILTIAYYYTHFIDHSFDGNYIHGETMIQLIYGYNPIDNSAIYYESLGMVYGVLYPKFTWIIGALFISLFKFSSAGMILNLLVALLALIKTFIYFKEKKFNSIYSFIISSSVLFNPIFLTQVHSLYVDGIIFNLFVLLLIFILELMENYSRKTQVMVVLLSIMLINIKFSSFAFTGIINLAPFIYYLFNERKIALKIFYSGLVMILIGVFMIGYNPYMINILNGRSIFFPLMGEDKWDIITSLLLEPLIELRSSMRFFYSITYGDYFNNLFDFSSKGLISNDERIGGLGFNFAKLLFLTFILLSTYILKYCTKIKLEYFLVFSLFTISILANYQNIWWARYAPQLWLVVPLGILLIIKLIKNRHCKNILLGFFIFLFVQQGIDIFSLKLENDLDHTNRALAVYEKYEGQHIELTLNNGNLSNFYVFEEYKMIEHGVFVDKLRYDFPDPTMECTPFEMYEVCIVLTNSNSK